MPTGCHHWLHTQKQTRFYSEGQKRTGTEGAPTAKHLLTSAPRTAGRLHNALAFWQESKLTTAVNYSQSGL